MPVPSERLTLERVRAWYGERAEAMRAAQGPIAAGEKPLTDKQREYLAKLVEGARESERINRPPR